LILGGAALLIGLGVCWRRYETSHEQRGHERFAAAVEQLASDRADGTPRTEARLGGIYALERLAADSDHEYWPIMEVLTAYVRENAAGRTRNNRRGVDQARTFRRSWRCSVAASPRRTASGDCSTCATRICAAPISPGCDSTV